MLYKILDVLLYVIPLIVIPMSVKVTKGTLQLAKEYMEAGETINARFEYSWAGIMITIAVVASILTIIKFSTFVLIAMS